MPLDFSQITTAPPTSAPASTGPATSPVATPVTSTGLDFSKVTTAAPTSVKAPVATPVSTISTPQTASDFFGKIWGNIQNTFSQPVAKAVPGAKPAFEQQADKQDNLATVGKNISTAIKTVGGAVVNEANSIAQELPNKGIIKMPSPRSPLVGPTTQDLKNTPLYQAGKAGLNAIDQGVYNFSDAVAPLDKPATPSTNTIANNLGLLTHYGMAGTNLLFSGINAAFASAEKIPALKPSADLMGQVFSVAGKVLEFPTDRFANSLPITDPVLKAQVVESMDQVATLGGQLILGGKIMGIFEGGHPVTKETLDKAVAETKAIPTPPSPEETKANIATLAQKYLGTPDEPTQTAPADVTNKLTDEGYSKSDISRIVSDLYQANPNGDFTQAQIDTAKQNYIPKGKDAATVVSDLSGKGYSPDEQNTVLKNLYVKSPEGNFLKADVNAETQSMKGHDLYPTEAAKLAEEKAVADTKARAINEKEAAKTQAAKDKADENIKAAQVLEAKAKTDHTTAQNYSEQAKGNTIEAQKSHEQSQKDQVASQKKLQDTNAAERKARIALEEAKAKIAEAQAKSEKTPAEKAKKKSAIAKARAEAARAKVEATKAKIELEKAKEDAKNSVARTKSLTTELQKAKIDSKKAEDARVKAREKYIDAQKNTQDTKPVATKKEEVSSPLAATESVKDTNAPSKEGPAPAKAEESTTKKSQTELKGKFAQKTEELLKGTTDIPDAEKRSWTVGADKSFDIISKDMDRARAILRGEEPVPAGIEPANFWKTAKDYLDLNPNEDLKNDLINSDIRNVTETARNLNAAKIIAKDAVAQGIKDMKDAMRASNPKGEAQANDIVKETQDNIKQESNSKSLDEFLKENPC